MDANRNTEIDTHPTPRRGTNPRASVGRARAPNGSACEKCRKKKIKCTGERPACMRCDRLRQECTYLDQTVPEQTGRTVSELQEENRRLRRLTQRSRSPLAPSDATRFTSSESRRMDVQADAGPSFTPEVSLRHSHPRGFSPGMGMGTSIGNTSPVMSHSPTVDAAIRHIIPASEAETVSPRYEAISTTYPKPHDRPLPSNDQALLHLPSDLGVSFFERNPPSSPQSQQARPQLPLVRIDRSVLPSERHVRHLIHHFEVYTSAAFPIFHIPSLHEWVDKVCFKGEPVESEVACSVILVLAVSAGSLAPGSHQEHLRMEAPALWEYGQKFLPPVFLPPIDESRGLLRVQVMLIRLQYVMYNPSAGNVWGLSGAAVRASVDLGLHHDARLPGGTRSAVETDLRRRVFWIAYSCDRDLGMALGRPPAIQDEWIAADYPSDRDDTLISKLGVAMGPAAPSKLTAIHVFRIRRLQSEVIFGLYASGRRETPTLDWFNDRQRSIDEWNSTRPRGFGFCSNEWLELCYHQTVTLLHRPCPGNPQPTRESLVRALQGSNATMRLYKEIYRKGLSSFGWLSMYHLFISGVTYLNSLWQAYRNGWRLVPSYVDALLDLQVCTSVMEGLASLTPGAASIRNTWEMVSEKMIRQLSSNARWDPLSRCSSPALGNPALPRRNDGLDQTLFGDFSGTTGEVENGIFGLENPFDSFLLHPLGEMSEDDWARAVAMFGTSSDNDQFQYS